MSAEITIPVTRTVEVPVSFLKAECCVRYWEDAEINGVADEDGTLTPLREGNDWAPLIELATGKVVGWPEGTTASIHFKVCDAGRYSLLDSALNPVLVLDGYVPRIMCPKESGYGDYVIMDIDASGQIDGWRVDLGDFR